MIEILISASRQGIIQLSVLTDALTIVYSMTLVVKKWNNSRGYIGAAYSIPMWGCLFGCRLDYTVLTPINRIVSAILLMALPFSQRGVLLFAIYLGGTGVPAYVLALAWCASSSTGHTKKTTANAMLQIGYCEMLFYTACCFLLMVKQVLGISSVLKFGGRNMRLDTWCHGQSFWLLVLSVRSFW